MSDFGLDAYALDQGDATGHSHPLEIASNLIAAGKPRAALELLSMHHRDLADDPEYLLVCSEAWLSDGDELRAQQALLGAARLAPEDPRPLLWLGELLAKRGEHDRADRVLTKARALESRASQTEAGGAAAELGEDLIAFAERQERSTQAALTPTQVLLVLLGLTMLVLLIVGISQLASPPGQEPDREVTVDPQADLATKPESTAAGAVSEPVPNGKPSAPSDLISGPSTVRPVQISEPVPSESPPAAVPNPAPPAPMRATAKPARKVTPRSSNAARSTSSRRATPVPSSSEEPSPRNEPDPALVQAELASMTPQQLTVRADALHAQGHTALASSYYRRALEIDPDYAPALVGIGRSILRAKKYSEAMKNATRALELARGVDSRPGLEAAAIYQLGRVHYERGDRDKARRLFRQSISLPGAPAEAWFYLGEALSRDNSPAAREAYEEFLKLVPQGNLAARAQRAIQ